MLPDTALLTLSRLQVVVRRMIIVHSNQDGRTARLEGTLEELAELCKNGALSSFCELHEYENYVQLDRDIHAIMPGTPEWIAALEEARKNGGHGG